MDSQNSLASTTVLCVKGCGFYGSAENRNMCSKCHNDYLKQEVIAKSLSATKPVVAIPADVQSLSTETPAVEEMAAPVVKKRCECCNKKVGLTGFACRCGMMLCSTHRYPKEHHCAYDFKTADREILAKRNPLLKGEKLDNKL